MLEPENDTQDLAERQDALTSLLVLLSLVQAGDWASLLRALPASGPAPAPAPREDTAPPA